MTVPTVTPNFSAISLLESPRQAKVATCRRRSVKGAANPDRFSLTIARKDMSRALSWAREPRLHARLMNCAAPILRLDRANLALLSQVFAFLTHNDQWTGVTGFGVFVIQLLTRRIFHFLRQPSRPKPPNWFRSSLRLGPIIVAPCKETPLLR